MRTNGLDPVGGICFDMLYHPLMIPFLLLDDQYIRHIAGYDARGKDRLAVFGPAGALAFICNSVKQDIGQYKRFLSAHGLSGQSDVIL